MLRIELLPDYIHDKNKIRNLGVVWIAGLAVVVFMLFAWSANAGRADDAAKADRQAKEDLEKITVQHKTDISNEEKARAITESKQKFVLNSRDYNNGWAEAFETIRDVKPADNSIVLDSMSLDAAKHQTVSLTGFGSDEKAIVRWWMSLRNNTALFDHVNFDLIPHSFAPVSQDSNGGGMGMAGPGKGPMGLGGGGSGGFGGNRAPKGPMGLGGGGSGGGMMGGGGGASGTNGPGELAGHQGIDFTALVVLKTALAGGITTPVWPAGVGGGAGGPGGFGGGMSGGSGGAMPGMKMGGAS